MKNLFFVMFLFALGYRVGPQFFGWIRGKYPTYGDVPPGAQWFMDTLGLCMFVAVVGINAGPSFTSGLSSTGWGLLLLGAVATVVPLLVGFLVSHSIQKIGFPFLMVVLADGQTTTAAIGAINETSRAQIPTLGYTTRTPSAMCC